MRPAADWLTGHARFRPQAEAVCDVGAGRRWTYAALHARALQWAGRLRAEGVGPGDRVAVLALNSAETFALLFACGRLGAVLLPLNWRLSPEELRWQLDDCDARLVFADAAHAAVPLGRPTRALEAGPGAPPAALEELPGAADDAPWVLMYTSGSTGKPKGALLTHRQLTANAVNTVLACDLRADSCTLTFTPLFHTGGLNCLSTPLLFRGGRVVLTPGLDAGQALGLIGEESVTHLMGVPTIYQMLADHPAFDRTPMGRVVDALSGGAALALPLMERYHARGIPLRQGFGMTEVGPNCFSMPGDRALEKMRAGAHPTEGPPGSCVGLPMVHLEMRLVGADGADVADGEPGELWMRGDVVFGGYWGRPEATAACFADGGWFRTGDVLSRDHEGYFHVRGRIKEMYKSGGENVYPAEVEAVIAQHPAVALAVVVGVPDPRWGEVGRAFLELHPGHTLDAAGLRAFLDGRLARFKMPRHVDVTGPGGLPRTGSGKLDKPALARLPLPPSA
jgi:fatty-acyl-CoA synthase